MMAALLFVPCTALRRIHEYVIHTQIYLTVFETSRVLTHLHYLSYLAYITLPTCNCHHISKQQAANSIIGPSVTYV